MASCLTQRLTRVCLGCRGVPVTCHDSGGASLQPVTSERPGCVWGSLCPRSVDPAPGEGSAFADETPWLGMGWDRAGPQVLLSRVPRWCGSAAGLRKGGLVRKQHRGTHPGAAWVCLPPRGRGRRDVVLWPRGFHAGDFIVDVADTERSVCARRCFKSFMRSWLIFTWPVWSVRRFLHFTDVGTGPGRPRCCAGSHTTARGRLGPLMGRLSSQAQAVHPPPSFPVGTLACGSI